MQLQFFPSRQISLYMAKLFLVRTLAVLLMLVLVLQTLDLLGESGKILSVAGNGEGDLWRYIGWRAPQLIARFLPFSVLLCDADHLCDVKPEQRSRGDESSRAFRAPDIGADDPHQPVCRGDFLCL